MSSFCLSVLGIFQFHKCTLHKVFQVLCTVEEQHLTHSTHDYIKKLRMFNVVAEFPSRNEGAHSYFHLQFLYLAMPTISCLQ